MLATLTILNIHTTSWLELLQSLQLQLQESEMGQGLHREGSSSSGSSSSIGGGATDSRVPGTGWASGGPACGLGTRLYNLWASFAVAEPCMPGCTLPCHMHTHTHTHTHTITPGLHVDPDITHTHFPLSLQCYLCHHIPQRDSSPCGLHGTQISDVQMILRDHSCLWNVVWRVDDVGVRRFGRRP